MLDGKLIQTTYSTFAVTPRAGVVNYDLSCFNWHAKRFHIFKN